MNVPFEKEFIFHDGSRARNIEELLQKIKSLSPEEFSGFVNSSKNDFANWIEQVLLMENLGKKLRRTNSMKKTVRLIEKQIRKEKKKNKKFVDLFNIFKVKNEKMEKSIDSHYFFVNNDKQKKEKDFRINFKKNPLIEWYNLMKNNKEEFKENSIKISEVFLWKLLYGFIILLIILILFYKVFVK
ncbi:MAG: hypothetical protein QXL18_03440 [Candidatus Woesearchaeota archaeon]